MATAKKAAGKTGKSTTDTHPAHAPARNADPVHPEVDRDRHPASGMQEMPTAGGAKSGDQDAPAGNADPKGAPNPSIGVNRSEDDTDGTPKASVASDAKFVYTLEQARSLPEVDAGSPLTMPSDKQLEADRDAQADKLNKAAAKRNEKRKDGTPEEDEDVQLPIRKPVLSFKGVDRRTMVVVKTADGLGVRPAKAFEDVEAAA